MKMHTELTTERWFKLSLVEQMANVGSDVIRTINWRKKGNVEYAQAALWRALELIDLMVADPKNRMRLKEPLRVREALIDYFMYDNDYKSSDELWENYFNWFGIAAAVQRGR